MLRFTLFNSFFSIQFTLYSFTRSHGLKISHHSDSEESSPMNQLQTVWKTGVSHGVIDPTQLAFTWDLFDGQQPVSLSSAMTLPESRKPLATVRERKNHTEKPTTTTISSPKRAKLCESVKDPEPAPKESTSFFDPSDDEIRWEDVA